MPRVLIAVFDGLQSAQVTPELMPNLSALAARGVTFANHHAVFPTVTRINGASMVTGRYPGSHGIPGNQMVAREFDPYKSFSALEPTLAQVAQKTGRVLLAPTLADILHRSDQEYIAVGTGTSGNAYMHNPNAERSGGATIHPDFCLPYSLYDEIIARFGPWPDDTTPNTARLAHAVRIMTEYVLPERQPAASLIWFSEPDHAQHAHGVGSDIAGTAIFEADREFGRLLEWLDRSGLAADTDVMVISDHGYSTITEVVDVAGQVKEVGFPAGDQRGGVIVAGNGGSVLFYTHESDQSITDRLAAWLMAQPWCGALAASQAVADIEGALPANLVGGNGPRAPELWMSFKWNSEPNSFGLAGHAYAAGGTAGLGQHGSMSRHETHNILYARGPSFKWGVSLDSPSGNVDLAPTVLYLLGITPDEPMDGRALTEALTGNDAVEWSTDVHRTERFVQGGRYSQQIIVSLAGNTLYVDEGQASLG